MIKGLIGMNIRPIREEDIEQVIQLFRLNYGDNYAIPEFYDPQWVKRGIYSDHIIWLVIEENEKVVASGAAILNYGDYNDQIAEIGRLVVDPATGGKGLGRTLFDALVDASDDRVEFAFGEARTTHIKTQRIFDRVGLAPLGFLPMHYTIQWRESWVLSGQLFSNGRRLRHPESVRILPQIAPIASLALANLDLDPNVSIVTDARPYPLEGDVHIEPLSGKTLVRLLKIEQGRTVNPEVFGGLHVDQGLPHLQANKAIYLVANEGEETLGAVGYLHDEANRSLRIIELIAREDRVKGSLLRQAVEDGENTHQVEVIDCDMSAHNARIQRTFIELGFLPCAYIPGMVFHNTQRWDVVRMMKLNVPWDLGPIELSESSQAMFDVVTPPFISRESQRASRKIECCPSVLAGLSAVEIDFFQHASEMLVAPLPDPLPTDSLYIVLEGAIQAEGREYPVGTSLAADVLLRRAPGPAALALPGSRLLRLTLHDFDALCERYPRLGMKLYRNLAEANR
jgi:RimJ/RimL family protein N-acetyltransferase